MELERTQTGAIVISEATEATGTELLQTLLDSWSSDLDASERRHLRALAEQLQHVRSAGLRSSNDGALAWRCADQLTRVHVPTWVEATPGSQRAELLRHAGPIVDAASAAAAAELLSSVRSTIADRRRLSRDVVQKETWSRAWPSAWNMESSARWAYARDASLNAAATSSWRAAMRAAKRSGFLALRDTVTRTKDQTLDALCEIVSELTNELIADIAWSAAWQPTWAAATASNYVPRVDLDQHADMIANEAIDPTSKVLFEETLVFTGELLQTVV